MFRLDFLIMGIGMYRKLDSMSFVVYQSFFATKQNAESA